MMGVPGGEEKKGTETLFKQLVRTFQTYGKNWTLQFKKLTEHLIASVQKDLQDTLY